MEDLGTETFSQSWGSSSGVAIFGAAVALGALASLAYVVPRDYKDILPACAICIAFFAVGIMLVLLGLKARQTIDFDNHGIRVQLGKRSSLLSWGDIQRIRNRPIAGWIEVEGGSGRQCITLSYRLDAIERVLELLVERAPLGAIVSAGRKRFTTSFRLAALMFLLTAFFIGWAINAYESNDMFPALAFLAIAALGPIGYAIEYRALTIGPASITIRRLASAHEIPFRDVSSVRVVMDTALRGGRYLALRIEGKVTGSRSDTRLGDVLGARASIRDALIHAGFKVP